MDSMPGTKLPSIKCKVSYGPDMPSNQSLLIIGGKMGLRVELATKHPNWWWRMWMWVLMGIEWEKL